MSAYMGILVIRVMTAVVGHGRGGSVGGTTPVGQPQFQKLLAPSISWERAAGAVVFLLALGLVSAVLSTLAWTGSRRNHDIRSVGGGGAH
jgi:hypothetical protein